VEHARESLSSGVSRQPPYQWRCPLDVICTHCAGLEVPKQTVMACRVTPEPTGQQADGLMEGREFGTLTRDLLALSDGLAQAGITQVAMESTGA